MRQSRLIAVVRRANTFDVRSRGVQAFTC